jgi:hypothetical protein
LAGQSMWLSCGDKCRDHVFVSSNSIYGDVEGDNLLVRMSIHLNARNLYSIAKIASELYCREFKNCPDTDADWQISSVTDRWTSTPPAIICHWFIRCSRWRCGKWSENLRKSRRIGHMCMIWQHSHNLLKKKIFYSEYTYPMTFLFHASY